MVHLWEFTSAMDVVRCQLVRRLSSDLFLNTNLQPKDQQNPGGCRKFGRGVLCCIWQRLKFPRYRLDVSGMSSSRRLCSVCQHLFFSVCLLGGIVHKSQVSSIVLIFDQICSDCFIINIFIGIDWAQCSLVLLVRLSYCQFPDIK